MDEAVKKKWRNLEERIDRSTAMVVYGQLAALSRLPQLGHDIIDMYSMHAGKEYFDDLVEKINDIDTRRRDLTPHAIAIMKAYGDHPAAKAVLENIQSEIQGEIQDYRTAFKEDDVVKILRKYDNCEYMVKKIVEGIKDYGVRTSIAITRTIGSNSTVEAINEFYKDVQEVLMDIGYATGDIKKVNQGIIIFRKYPRKFHDKIIAAMKMMEYEHFQYKQMNDPKAYEAVNRSTKWIENIGFYDYSDIKDRIRPRELAKELQYDELNLVRETLTILVKVHEKRSRGHWNKIKKGFYGEMLRAVWQVDDFDSRVHNLRTYCREVCKQIRENAPDLMVMHNE